MRSFKALIGSAVAGLSLFASPSVAQDSEAGDDESDALCVFHGEGCHAPPSEWAWQRHEPRIGVYSVELPCDTKQVDAFGQLLAMSNAPFEAPSTRACMKAHSGFTVSLLGFAVLPDGVEPSQVSAALEGEADMFSAFLKQVQTEEEIPIFSINGRRAVKRSVERDNGYSTVMVVEVSKFGILLLTGDIRSSFGATREESDSLIARFFDSVEFAQ